VSACRCYGIRRRAPSLATNLPKSSACSNGAFAAFTDERTDYYPTTLRSEIDAVNARVYETLNNGVYRCGLAAGQAIYEQVVTEMFATLDWLEARLAKSRYLVGETITEADWRLFPTLLRFDAVYYALFKCNLRHIYEYPALWGYARALYQMPGIAATCDIDECKLHYYGSLRMVNPSGVVPKGPKAGFHRAARAWVTGLAPGLLWGMNVDSDPSDPRPLYPRMCCKTRVLFTARPDLSIAEPVVFSTVPSGGAID
jgi:hypothetical protein